MKRILWFLIFALANSATHSLSQECGDVTNIWLSASSADPIFADTPFVNASSTTKLYIWAKLADGHSITDLSLNVEATGLVLSEAAFDNPVVGERSRFEVTAAKGDDSLVELTGFTFRERDSRGVGPASQSDDPLYDAATDAWRLGQLAVSGNDGTLSLQIGRNGIQGVDQNSEATPLFSVVFGDEADTAICALDARDRNSTRPDAHIFSGTLTAAEIGSLAGSYVQSEDADLILSVGELPWSIAGGARFDGDISISGELAPPAAGDRQRTELLTAQLLTGEFDRVFFNGQDILGTTLQHDGIFRTLDYGGTSVFLETYSAIAGDADGDGEVAFSDFLILSANFGQPGDWRSGDFDGDANVGFPDFLLLSNNFGLTAAAQVATVPEPVSLWLQLLLFWMFTKQIALSREKTGAKRSAKLF